MRISIAPHNAFNVQSDPKDKTLEHRGEDLKKAIEKCRQRLQAAQQKLEKLKDELPAHRYRFSNKS
jgi:chaperonin cofactor prefoldin